MNPTIKIAMKTLIPHLSGRRAEGLLKKNNKGLTLIEVIIVMALIGILAAIGFPTYLKWMPNIKLKEASKNLYGDMQFARIGAVRSNSSWAIVFNNNNTYTILDGDNNPVRGVDLAGYGHGISYGTGIAGGPVPTIPALTYTGGDPGISVSYNPNRVQFSPRGTANQEGYVYLTNSDNTSYAVGTSTSGSIRNLRWLGAWE